MDIGTAMLRKFWQYEPRAAKIPSSNHDFSATCSGESDNILLTLPTVRLPFATKFPFLPPLPAMEQRHSSPEYGVTPQLIKDSFQAKDELLANGLKVTYHQGQVIQPVSDTDLEILLHDSYDPTRQKAKALMNGSMLVDFRDSTQCIIDVPGQGTATVEGLPDARNKRDIIERILRGVIDLRNDRRSRAQRLLDDAEASHDKTS